MEEKVTRVLVTLTSTHAAERQVMFLFTIPAVDWTVIKLKNGYGSRMLSDLRDFLCKTEGLNAKLYGLACHEDVAEAAITIPADLEARVLDGKFLLH
jgi:hypothetical protein